MNKDALLNSYDLKSYCQNTDRIKLPAIKTGVCRFCGKSAPETAFQNTPHAFSNFLGNTCYISTDECDECNSLFSGYETDFHNYLIMDIIMGADINNFHRIPKKPQHWLEVIPNKANQSMEIIITSSKENEIAFLQNMVKGENTISFSLGKYTIIKQNIYKSLVKYVLSFLDADQLSHYRRAVDWLLNKERLNHLPDVVVYTNQSPAEGLYLNIYTRKNEADKKLPCMIGELRYTLNTYFFIIPETQKDEMEVKKDALVTTIFSTGYNTRDLSSDDKEPLEFPIVLHVPPQPKTITDILQENNDSINKVSIVQSFKNKTIEFTVVTNNGESYKSIAEGMEYQNRILKQ